MILTLHFLFSNNSVKLSVRYRCIMVQYQNHLWGAFHDVALLVLMGVTVGHIAGGRLLVTESVFLEVPRKYRLTQ
jgi:hypothetical protein